MSWTGSAWAKETVGHGSYAQKLVLMMLGEYHNTEAGVAYPSIKELARVCEMPERTVRWCLKHLEDMGFITTKQKGNQYQRSEYVLNFATTQGYALAMDGMVATAQSYEAAMDGAAMVASASAAAKSGSLQRQRVVSEAAIPVHTNRHEPLEEPSVRERETGGVPPTEEDKTVWPDWYAPLYDMPGFKTPLKAAQAWLDSKNISVEHAENTAYSLKSKWPGPAKSPYRDVWATFQTWVKRPPLAGTPNGSRPTRGKLATAEEIAEIANGTKKW